MDSLGEFLYTIGNKGRGPAEFEEMAGLSIDSEDIVTVFDRSAQLLKTFNSTGEFIKTIDLGKMVDSRIKFGKWKQYTLMSYILLRGDSNVLDQDYLHIYNQYNQVGSGVTPRDFKNLDKNYVKILSQFQGSIFIYEDTFYFVPYAYNGDIYKYQLSENTTTVQVAYDGIIEGYTHNPKRTRHITSTTEPVFWDAMRTGYGTTDYFVVYNQSLGLFKLKDGNIAHFTYIESTDGKQRTFGAELYDSTLQPIGYAPIITTPWGSKSSENYIRPWHFKWKDEEDRFYVVHLELGKPIQVHVVKFNFQMD